MQELGSYLKQIREEKGASIREMAEKTRIKPYLLEDIEKSEFSQMGGYGFARVTVITYAKSLGANQEKTIALFEQNYRAEREQRGSYMKNNRHHKLLLPGNILLILALVALVVVLSTVVWHLHRTGKLHFGMDEVLPQDETVTQSQPAPDTTTVAQQEPEPEPEAQVQVPEETPQEPAAEPVQHAVALAAPAIADTTDYVGRHVFRTQGNPLNVDTHSIPTSRTN